MTDAVGIHTHPEFKLGRRPAVDKPALRFADHLLAVPAHPIADPPPSLSWPMDENNVAGDCVVAALDHALQAISAALGVTRTNWTDGELLAFYQTQNPGFTSWADAEGPNDQGMVIQDFLSYLVKKGLILGFAKVDPTNQAEVQAATYLDIATVTGEDLTVAQQSQQVWDYVPGDQDWGGHCTPLVGYSAADDVCVTWGALTGMTQAFVTHQVSEVWFIITQAHVEHPGFRAGFDMAGFAAAYTQLTGRPFPVIPPAPTPPTPQPPAPGPTPTPTPPAPDPGAASFLVGDPRVVAHIDTVAGLRRTTPDAWLTLHLQHYFHLGAAADAELVQDEAGGSV